MVQELVLNMKRKIGADVFVTGDIKHHDALDAKIQGVNLLILTTIANCNEARLKIVARRLAI